MVIEKVTFIKDNGQKIVGEVYRPDNVKKYPTVIISHGFGSNYREFVHHADGFVSVGFACVFFDFCGGGLESLSDGQMTEMTPLTEVADLECVLRETIRLPYVDADKICLLGESMGGFVSAMVAANNRSVKSLILWYPAFNIPEDSKKRYLSCDNTCFGMELSPLFNMATMNIDIFEIISEYKGPVCIIHGNQDQIVPISFSHKAVEVYDNACLSIINGAGHGFYGKDSDSARNISIVHMKKVIG